MPLYELGDLRPQLGRHVWIAPSADVIGDVRLGDEASVWFGAVIRADNTAIVVGVRTNIQEGAVLHSDRGSPLTVGEGCTVGHHAILHGCTVGRHVLVGMGATILNGAVIGDGCLVGAGALVTEGKIFPPDTLIVGAPARAVRTLAPEVRNDLERSADHYVARARRFAEHLRPIGRDDARSDRTEVQVSEDLRGIVSSDGG